MTCLFVPVGSEGDINPLLWLADCMVARGHKPIFLITPYYSHLVARRGFEWHPVGSEEDFLRLAADPGLWKPILGTLRVAEVVMQSLQQYGEALGALNNHFDLVITSTLGLAASSWAESLGIPRLMLHLQPACMWSRHELPILGTGSTWLGALPDFAKQAVCNGINFALNQTLLPPLNIFRKKLGLPRIKHFYDEAFMGTEGVALLFPSWFMAPQADWPANIRQFDFPIQKTAAAPLPPALEQWINKGLPPVLWTHGSANLHIDEFHQLAIRSTDILGGRALLVSKKIPSCNLPDQIFHFSHVPFEDLFPHCQAVVHHGGIGTTAKAFAAGIPQLAIPLAHDQYDNASRMVRLGGGLQYLKRRRDSVQLAAILNRLLHSPEILGSVAECRDKMRQSLNSGNELCDWAEKLANT